MSSSFSSSSQPALLRYCLGLEAIANILTALPLIFTPATMLDLLLVPQPALDPAVAHPAAAALAPPSRAALQFAQYLGALILVITVPLLYGVRDAPAGPPSSATARAARAEKGRFRGKTYVGLAVGEAVLVMLLGMQLAGETTTSGTPGAVKPGIMMGGLLVLGNLWALRIWALVCHAEWFGEEVLGADKTKAT